MGDVSDEADDAAIEALRERVAELEAELEARPSDSDSNAESDAGPESNSNADTGPESTPNEESNPTEVTRRTALGVGGLLGAGGLLGLAGGASRPAAAASGQVGTPDHPVDLYGETVRIDDAIDESGLTGGQRLESLVGGNLFIDDAGALNAPAGDGGVGDSGWNVVESGGGTIYVDPDDGSDGASGTESDPVRTIQEAVDRVPFFNPRSAWRVDLTTAPSLPVRYDEDVVVGPYVGSGPDGGNFRIVGDRSDPGNVEIGSMVIHGCHGINAPSVWGVTFTRESEAISHGAACFVYASTNTELDAIRFDPEDGGSIDTGIEAYGGTSAYCDEVDVTNTNYGIKAKCESKLSARDATGTADEFAYFATEHSSVNLRSNEATGQTGNVRHRAGSWSTTSNMMQLRDLNPRALRIDDDPVRYGRLVEQRSPDTSSSTTTLEFTDLDDDHRYLLEYAGSQRETAGEITLRINGDSGSNYGYFDESGESSSGESAIPLVSPATGWAAVGGQVRLVSRGSYVGVDHDVQAMQVERIDGYAETGGYTEGSLESVEITFPSWSGDVGDHVDLWEINQPDWFGPGLIADESWDTV